MKFNQFRFTEPAPTLFANRQKVSLFRWLTRKVPPLFLCGGDIMTIGPMVTGFHEPDVLAVLRFLARSGFDRALIDVGANIGLITWHSREWFRCFHCYEPNPRMFNVLTANLASAFAPDGPALHLHHFALGDRDETAMLTVPLRNQGGAFIAGEANAYGADVLDDRKRTEAGMTHVPITIRQGRSTFRDLFGEMPEGRFVVKIDTEGYEQVIIREIAAAIPPGARIAIVFENLQRDFDASAFSRAIFGKAGSTLKLADNLDNIGSRLGKEIVKLTRGKVFQSDGSAGRLVGHRRPGHRGRLNACRAVGVGDVVARQRHRGLAMSELDLEHQMTFAAERDLGAAQVELEHAAEALVVQ
jgi:FkbM family methyltransferase